MALCGEAGELAAVLQWLTDDQIDGSVTIGGDVYRDVADEIADVLIYALRFCDVAGIDPAQAVTDKLAVNEDRYPVALSRGSAAKYDTLENCT
jgi:dCTP diphosphatase